MALNRQGTGLTILRILLGLFFLSLGLSKYRWFLDGSILAGRLSNWQQAAAAGSISAKYLQTLIPHAALFARLVPLGEIACGTAMLLGIWTSLFSFIAFLMVMNIHVASGALFHLAFLTDGYGLPVLGGTFALALGGVKLPWSLR